MWLDARNARHDASKAGTATTAGGSMAGMDMSASATNLGSLTSYAGAGPADADALGAAHKAYPAELPAAPAGTVANVNLVLTDLTVQIAPGLKYAAWAWAGGRARSGHSRPRGAAGQNHLDQQGRDPALGRLPRRPHRP
jgi:hypothetical protein